MSTAPTSLASSSTPGAPLVERRAFGAVLDRSDLGSLSAADLAGLRDLVDHHGVVFVRHFGDDEADLRRVAEHFGPLQSHPVDTLLGRDRTVSTIVDDVDRPPAGFPWHTDLSWLVRPPRYGFLQALEIPDHGGDTLWADLVHLATLVPDDVRSIVSFVDGVHGPDASLLASVRRHHGPEVEEALRRRHRAVLHPLLQAHPRSGLPTLALCPMYLKTVAGFTAEDSTALLGRLHPLLDLPSATIRWRWGVGDLIVWDEAATNHRALTDHAPRRRVMRRCTAGTAPVTRFPADESDRAVGPVGSSEDRR